MGGGESGEVSCAELDVGGAARVQLEGGLGKQLGEGACIALAKRSCLFGCLAMGRGEAILTTGGAPSGALAYGATVTDATRFCLAPGTTGVFGLRGMFSLRCWVSVLGVRFSKRAAVTKLLMGGKHGT